MKNFDNLKKKSKHRLVKINKLSKLVLRACLVTTFFILLSLFGLFAVCWVDSVYNSSKGIAKNPLLNAYIVVTESMVPTINVNDAVVITRIKDNTLDIGDIITFSSNDIYFNGLTLTHRVVGKQLGDDGNYIYRTKGDNNILEDTAIVNSNNIYGKVIVRVPKVGYVCKFVTSPGGLIISVITPVFGVIVYECYRIIKTIKRRYKEVEII